LYFSENHSSRLVGSCACSISSPVALSINFSRSISLRAAIPLVAPPPSAALALFDAEGGGART